MTWVKICGTTNLEDALTAVDAGADAIGFVFYPASPRNIHPEAAGKIAGQLPEGLEKVGVFVGHPAGGIATMKRIVHQAGLSAIQVYSQRGGSFASVRSLNELVSLNKKLFIAWSADMLINSRLGGFKWRSEAKDRVSAIFLDSGTREQRGGTGKTFDWTKAATVLSVIDGDFKFVIAGGLTPENVGEAMHVLKPWGVDVVSGVEASPGKKDPDKVRAFIKTVRDIDRKKS